MKFVTLCLVSLGHVIGLSLTVSPVQKVIQLLTGMTQKGTDEMHAEQRLFATYSQWCDDTLSDLKTQIASVTDTIAKESAQVEEHEDTLRTLALAIQGAVTEIGSLELEKKNATEARENGRTGYVMAHKDFTESIQALENAIKFLQRQAHDRNQASLVQVRGLLELGLIPQDTKRALGLFLQQHQPEDVEFDLATSSSSSEANAYEFQSTGVVDMLQRLLVKFQGERTNLETEEQKSSHAHNLLVSDLDARVESKSAAQAQMQMRSSTTKEAHEEVSQSLELHKVELAKDQTAESETTSLCAQKRADFDARQKLRSEELDAISKAREILSSEVVAGNEAKYAGGSTASSAALPQLRSDSMTTPQMALRFLSTRAKELKSAVLAQFVTRAAADPFVKVKGLIEDLITRLQEEAISEVTAKAWCDKELATNDQTRKLKTDKVAELHADVDSLRATIATLGEEIADASTEVAKARAEEAEATDLRTKTKAQNTEAIADAREAQTAVAQAVAVLKEFYASAAGATVLMQERRRQTPPPPIFDSPYNGQQGRNQGVIGLLEVIQSNFAQLEAETLKGEAAAQAEYEKLASDITVMVAGNERDIKNKHSQMVHEKEQLMAAEQDLEDTQKELASAVDYLEQLKPTCVNTGVTFGERDGARAKEIEALQEALAILTQMDQQ